MTWACTIRAVPPMVNADSDRIRGDAVYVGWLSSGTSSRQRSQPARFRARIEVSWVSGTCRITSPALFIPPVSSRSTSQAVQPVPVQASQISGGQSGRTPTPRDPAVHPDHHGAGRHRVRQADQQRVAGLRRTC